MKRRWIVLFLTAVVLSAAVPIPSRAEPTVSVDMRMSTMPDPSAVGESVALTAVVTPAPPGPAPTGTVTFADGETPLGSSPVDEDGTASLVTTFATPGNHELTASYSGDEVYLPTSITSTHTVEVLVSRKRWVGGDSEPWSDPVNWQPPAVPVDGDTVVLDTGVSVLDIDGLSLAHVSVVGDGHRVGPSATPKELTVAGTIHDDSEQGGTFDVPIVLPDGDHVVDGRITLNGVVSGPGGITKSGAPVLLLGAANTYGGATRVAAGVVTAPHAAGLGDPAIGTTVADGASLRLGTPGAEPLELTGDGVSDAVGALQFTAGGTHTGTIALSGERATISVWSVVSDVILSGEVSGEGGLRKVGAGVLSLTRHAFGENSFSGGTDIASGTVKPDGFSDSLGTGPVTVRPGAVLDQSQSMPLENHVTMVAGSVLTSSEHAAVRGEVTLQGPVTVRLPSPLHGLLLYGVVSGTGPIRKEGIGNLWLAGNDPNTMSGTTVVAAGTLLGNSRNGDVSLPDGVVIEKDGSFTHFIDDQLGDDAPLVVHGSAYFAGTGDRFGSLTVTGLLYTGFFIDNVRTDFGIIEVDSLNMATPEARLTMAVEPDAGPSPGVTHDQLRVGSTVTLDGRLFVRGNVPWGTTVKLIDNTGTAPVSGRFRDIPEGGQVPTSPRPTFLSYRGGDGNDVTLTTPPARSGYWMLGADGAVYPFGQARHFGDARGRLEGAAPADIEPTTTHNGYWILLSNGTVLSYGNAPALGSVNARLQSGERATSISNTGWNHFWVFTDRGRALPVAQAGHFGDMAGRPLNGPVLGSVGAPDGYGYYMVASDGGIFTFGSATFRGSMGGQRLNGPVVGLAPDPDWDGYWLVASDGGIFSFAAPFRGSMGGRHLNRPVVGMVAYGDGYLMVASDGGIFNFSSKPFHGSLGGNPPAHPIVGVAPLNEH